MQGASSPAPATAPPSGSRHALAVLTSLFFLWGFITVLNDVLVPHWKALFNLTYAQSLLVQFCFFGAYFIGSLIYYFISVSSGDPIERIGYKRGLLLGLGLSALGCALFAPASLMHSYGAHLAALFVLGLGFTVLQIAANPFVAIIGPPEGASSRLNLAQAFNSLGTTLAPLIGGWLIFDQVDASSAVRAPYLGLALVLAAIAVVVWATRLPEPARPPRTEAVNSGSAFRHPQLRWGMVAIFCYVGAEVAVGSLIISFLNLDGVMGFSEDVAKHYLSLYWGGAMAGRFIGAVALSRTMAPGRKLGVMATIGAAMFILLIILNATGPVSITDLWPMALLIAANIAVALLAKGNPGRTMGLFASVAVLLLAAVVAGKGSIALWSIVAIGLFNSILWSNIFTLSIDGLRNDTAQGSSLLVMMILGGALVPWVQASIIDLLSAGAVNEQAFHLSFLLPLACYAYLVWYGLRGSTLRSRI
ncbi:MAG: sugar MFS transporter [Flavobacteriales bacterium]|nr:sugar MFS transporter [Flavobacteriales bacterium]